MQASGRGAIQRPGLCADSLWRITDHRLPHALQAVVDDWQRRGVGGRLAAALAKRAREEGITSFSALVLADNKPMMNLAAELGRVRNVHREHGTVELTVELLETGVGQVARLLRAVAGGEPRPFQHQTYRARRRR